MSRLPAAESNQVIVKYCFPLFLFAQLFMQSTNVTALRESEPNVEGHDAPEGDLFNFERFFWFVCDSL